MCLVIIVFTVFVYTTVINDISVFTQEEDVATVPPEEPLEERTESPPLENHSFVALIDILFADGSKRMCTGTIIHDHVVITAAHCFLTHEPEYVDVELSGSFVVIGTKKMFDTGYENYLPIERIITHPRYKGWTADLALVFTFAGMTTDKSGHTIPLIGENASTPVDSNVTILSWGRCANLKGTTSGSSWTSNKKRQCISSEEDNESCETTSTQKPLRMGSVSSEQEPNTEPDSSQHQMAHGNEEGSSQMSTKNSKRFTTMQNSHKLIEAMNVLKLSQANGANKARGYKQLNEPRAPLEPKQPNVSGDTFGQKTSNTTTTLRRLRKRRFEKAHRNESSGNYEEDTQEDAITNLKIQPKSTQIAVPSYYMNSRKQYKLSQTPKEHKLAVETFGFVNVQTCKKLIDKALPSTYEIITNEVVCFAAEDHFISDEDSGAPAIRQGHLVAVTVGGVEGEGDHVAIGMRMDCFCSWIAENLPAGGTRMNYCTNHCGGTKYIDRT